VKRCFVAVDLSSADRELLSRWRLKAPEEKGVKWVESENLHVTLKFLGGIPEERLDAAIQAVEKAALCAAAFRVRFSGAGAFPDFRRPSVFWTGAAEGSEDLKRLAEIVEDEFLKAGFDREERVWVPHLTLARAKESRVRETTRFFESFPPPDFFLRVSEIALLESVLSSAGPHYIKCATFSLRSSFA